MQKEERFGKIKGDGAIMAQMSPTIRWYFIGPRLHNCNNMTPQHYHNNERQIHNKKLPAHPHPT